jgi:D-alanine-D-alanine ligase-like ATP-grasp enzyme
MNKMYEKLELSTQILIQAALERDIDVEVIDPGDNFIRLSKDGKVEYVKQATRTSADTYIAPLIMENKAVTKFILKENGISTPDGITVTSTDEAMNEYGRFKGGDIVIKPNSTNFGKGVRIMKAPYSESDYLDAVRSALECDSSALIEEYIPGGEYRFLVIGGDVAAVLQRIPANVTGNGRSTIEELVVQKNLDPKRGSGYVTPLEKIRLGEIEKEYLAKQGKDTSYVPGEGETVWLRENSNISTGGDSIDYTDKKHEGYKEIALAAARAVGARICGADMIVRNIKSAPEKNNYSIIELNFNPALHIHNFPYKGRNRDVGNRVLDLLGF